MKENDFNLLDSLKELKKEDVKVCMMGVAMLAIAWFSVCIFC